MFVTKGDEQWQVDEFLREKAGELTYSFEDEVGYVELDKVIFVRVIGSKSKWLGKCFQIKCPNTIIPIYIINNLCKLGVIKKEDIPLVEESFYDIRYIIALNDNKIRESVSQNDPEALDKMESVTLLHELKHIGKDMEGLNKHDCEDFKFVLDKFGTHWDEGLFEESPEEDEGPIGEKTFEEFLAE